jgi:hypothetical protein
MNAILALGKSLHRPTHVRRLLHDALRRCFSLEAEHRHVQAAVRWLDRAQRACTDGAVSVGYSMGSGRWLEPKPRAACRAISAWLRAAPLLDDWSLVDRASEAGIWTAGQVDLQVRHKSDGQSEEAVLTLAMAATSWIQLYDATGQFRFLSAACNAAAKIAQHYSNNGTAEAVSIPDQRRNAVTARALLEVFRHTSDEGLLLAAGRRIDQLLDYTQDNGWPGPSALAGGDAVRAPVYQIGMILDSLIQCLPRLTGQRRKRAEQAAAAMAERSMVRFELNKPQPDAEPRLLPAAFTARWRSEGSYSCNLGTAQIAGAWLRFHCHADDARFLNAALKALDHLKKQQSLRAEDPGIAGAIPAARPCWAAMFASSFPVSATAKTIAVLARQEEIMEQLERP